MPRTTDPTESPRRALGNSINNEPGDREKLAAEHGQVWNTSELTADFTVHSFLAPFVEVTRKADNVRGLMLFQHMPRYYFAFTPHSS